MTSALIRFRVRRETYTFHCNPPQIRWPFAGIDIYMPNTRWYCAAHLFMVSKQFEWPILNGFLFSWLTLLGCVYRVALCSRLINNKNRLRSSTPHTERLTWGVFWDNSIASATTVFFFDLWFFSQIASIEILVPIDEIRWDIETSLHIWGGSVAWVVTRNFAFDPLVQRNAAPTGPPLGRSSYFFSFGASGPLGRLETWRLVIEFAAGVGRRPRRQVLAVQRLERRGAARAHRDVRGADDQRGGAGRLRSVPRHRRHPPADHPRHRDGRRLGRSDSQPRGRLAGNYDVKPWIVYHLLSRNTEYHLSKNIQPDCFAVAFSSFNVPVSYQFLSLFFSPYFTAESQR